MLIDMSIGPAGEIRGSLDSILIEQGITGDSAVSVRRKLDRDRVAHIAVAIGKITGLAELRYVQRLGEWPRDGITHEDAVILTRVMRRHPKGMSFPERMVRGNYLSTLNL